MSPFELCWAILTPLIHLGPVFKFYLLSKMKTMGSQVLIIYWHTAVPTRTEEQGSRCVFKRATLCPKSIRRHIGCQAALLLSSSEVQSIPLKLNIQLPNQQLICCGPLTYSNIDTYIQEKCSITMSEGLFSSKIQCGSFTYLTGFAIYFG